MRHSMLLMLLYFGSVLAAPISKSNVNETTESLLRDFALYFELKFPEQKHEAARQHALQVEQDYNSAARIMATMLGFLKGIRREESALVKEYGDRIKTPATDTFEALHEKVKHPISTRYDQFRNWAVSEWYSMYAKETPQADTQALAGRNYFVRDFQAYYSQFLERDFLKTQSQILEGLRRQPWGKALQLPPAGAAQGGGKALLRAIPALPIRANPRGLRKTFEKARH